MFAFFDSITEIIATIVNFVVTIVEMIMHFLRIVFGGISFLLMIIPNLPAFAVTFLTVIICVAVLLQLLNKGA